jgi:hypothetical protein
MKATYRFVIFLTFILLLFSCNKPEKTVAIFCTHQVAVDKKNKLLPWYTPMENAYDHFLKLRWNFIRTRVPLSPGPLPRSLYPQYYFYCAFKPDSGRLLPDTWMNDIGEKIPNWFESARLFYAYTGDSSVMKLVCDFIDYTMKNGTSPSDFGWPGFPYTTTNAGDTVFRGFTSAGRLALHETHIDHAGEIGLTYYRMYCYSGENKYLEAAVRIADVLAENAKTGTSTESVLPYRVIMDKGLITAAYGANWTGCYMLFDNLINAGKGNVTKYMTARNLIKEFLLEYPMKTGYWTDGHTDTDIKSNTYKSNLSASNMTLCLFDYPDLDPDRGKHIPELIKWTEDNFIFRSAPGEPSTMWGANIVGEQDSFNFKMDYQTARYAAECARWYALSGDESYKEKAFRSLNWVTYCNDTTGMAFESPVSKGILSWWSDCYGECPRMFYHAFAGMPQLAPPGEDHILYSEIILKDISYGDKKIRYTATTANGVEYLRLSFKPSKVTIEGRKIPGEVENVTERYILRKIGGGDFSLIVKHEKPGDIVISG